MIDITETSIAVIVAATIGAPGCSNDRLPTVFKTGRCDNRFVYSQHNGPACLYAGSNYYTVSTKSNHINILQ